MARRRSIGRTRHYQPARRRFRMRQLLLVMLIVLPTITLSSASPQQSPSRSQPAPPDGLPLRGTRNTRVLIDGAVNPERVDRNLLTAQIMRTMAIPPSPSAAEERRLHRRALAIGFSRRDEQVLRSEMIRLHNALVPIRAQLDAIRSRVPVAELAAYRQARLDSYSRLLRALSPDGANKLDRYIERARRNVKVFTGSNQ
jgi:hypothetical protein